MMKTFVKYIASCIFLLSSFNLYAGVSVIVHSSNASSFTDKDISKIFLGKKKSFPSGGQVVAINLSEGNAVRQQFNQTVIGKTDSQLKSYWSKLIFTGKGTPPKEVGSDAEVISLVSSNPNMIGYVDSGSVTGDVKVVFSF